MKIIKKFKKYIKFHASKLRPSSPLTLKSLHFPHRAFHKAFSFVPYTHSSIPSRSFQAITTRGEARDVKISQNLILSLESRAKFSVNL